MAKDMFFYFKIYIYLKGVFPFSNRDLYLCIAGFPGVGDGSGAQPGMKLAGGEPFESSSSLKDSCH